MQKIILASTSPRRKDILSLIKVPFDIVASDYEEDMSLDMSPTDLVKYLSWGKADAVAKHHSESIVIGADTIVVCEGKIFGKPKDEKEAVHMLQTISDKKIEVVTGIALIHQDKKKKISEAWVTDIYMKSISLESAKRYVATGEPLDKAWAFIPQWIWSIYVDHIEWDYLNALWLPLYRVIDHLEEMGVKFL